VQRLPGQRGEREQEALAQIAPAPVQSALGVDLGRHTSLDTALVLALQRSAGNAAVTALMPDAPGPAVEAGATPEASGVRPVAAEGSVQRALARSALRRAQSLQCEDHGAAGGSGPLPVFRSPALLLRSRLRSGPSIGRATLQRVVKTSGGEWDTDKYNQAIDVDLTGSPVPAAQGMRGVDIDLRFKPNADVDATLIGLTQTAQTYIGGAPQIVPAAATRSIAAGDAEAINTGTGETDESTHIDQSATNTNPIYAVESPTSTSLADASNASFGENGWHYKDKANKIKKHDALLKDTPRAPGAQKDSRQIFETTALATKGVQAGTYYGSVRWGWRTDGTGAYTKIAVQKVSDGVPSSTFLKSAGIWNPGKSSTGAANVDLPIPDVKITTAPVTLVRPVPQLDIPLPLGTRLQVVREFVVPLLAGEVKVVDGPHTGITGQVDGGEWSNIADERA
jgi:hypothetical protein